MGMFSRYPELEYFEREDLQHLASEALTTARHEVMRSWSFWLASLALWVLAIAASVLAARLFQKYIGSPRWVESLLNGGAWVVVSCGVWWLFRRRTRRHLREMLFRLGVPICIPCGYDLRGSKERCPECGTKFQIPETRTGDQSSVNLKSR